MFVLIVPTPHPAAQKSSSFLVFAFLISAASFSYRTKSFHLLLHFPQLSNKWKINGYYKISLTADTGHKESDVVGPCERSKLQMCREIKKWDTGIVWLEAMCTWCTKWLSCVSWAIKSHESSCLFNSTFLCLLFYANILLDKQLIYNSPNFPTFYCSLP